MVARAKDGDAPPERDDVALRNTLQNLGIKFADLLKLPLEQRKPHLLALCQDVYCAAMDKYQQNMTGKFPAPDCSAANKVIETVAKLCGVAESDSKSPPGESGEALPSVAAISGAAERLERSRKSKTAA